MEIVPQGPCDLVQCQASILMKRCRDVKVTVYCRSVDLKKLNIVGYKCNL